MKNLTIRCVEVSWLVCYLTIRCVEVFDWWVISSIDVFRSLIDERKRWWPWRGSCYKQSNSIFKWNILTESCSSLPKSWKVQRIFIVFSVILKDKEMNDTIFWFCFLQEIKKKYRNWCKWPGHSSMTGKKKIMFSFVKFIYT